MNSIDTYVLQLYPPTATASQGRIHMKDLDVDELSCLWHQYSKLNLQDSITVMFYVTHAT